MPPFSLSTEEVRFEEVQVLKTPAPDCMAPLSASSALPQPYPDLPRADLFQPPFTEQETEAQRAMILVPGHTASRLLVWGLGDLVFNLSSALPVTLGKSLISRFPRQECKTKMPGVKTQVGVGRPSHRHWLGPGCAGASWELRVLNFAAKFLCIRQAAVSTTLGPGWRMEVGAWSQPWVGEDLTREPAVSRPGARSPGRSIYMQ